MKRQITFLIVVIAMFGLVFFQTAFGTATSLAVEQIDLRTSNAKVYQNSDGSGYAEVYQIPVHYQDEQGVWQEIDNTLVLNTNGVWENVGNSFNVSLSSSTETLNRNTVSKTTLPMASFTNGLYTIAFAPIGTQASVGEVSESKITYSNAYPSADLIYQVTNMSLKEAVVYHKIPTNQTLEFALFVTGGIPTLHPNGSLSLGDCSNNCLQVQPPYLEDATGAITENIVVNLTKIDEGAYILEYLLGSEWLSASERVYPVIFDPTVTQHVGKFFYAQERYANTPTCNAQRYTFVGYSPDSDLGGYGKRRTQTYFHFGLPSLPSGSTVTGATLYAWQHIRSGGNTGGYTTKVYRVTSQWDNNCTAYTWNNRPSVDGTEHANSFITTSQDWKTWNITGLVQQWYGGTDNYGLMIAAAPETARGSAFCSVVAGDGQCGANTEQKRPYIRVDYTTNTPPPPTITPVPTPVNEKILSVRYVDQVFVQQRQENGYWNHCGPASTSMVIHYKGKESRDVLYDRQATLDLVCGIKKNCRGIAWVDTVYNGRRIGIIPTLQNKGLGAFYRQSPTFAQLKQSIDRGNPVILGIGEAGHLVTVVGYRGTNTIIINDPYGGFRWWAGGPRNTPAASTPKLRGYNIAYTYGTNLTGRYAVFLSGSLNATPGTTASIGSNLSNENVTINWPTSHIFQSGEITFTPQFTSTHEAHESLEGHIGIVQPFTLSATVDSQSVPTLNSPLKLNIQLDPDVLTIFELGNGYTDNETGQESTKRVQATYVLLYWDNTQAKWVNTGAIFDTQTQLLQLETNAMGEYAVSIRIDWQTYLPLIIR